MSQQFREILAPQVFAESAVAGGLAEFVKNRECDVFLIRGSAFVGAELSAGFADQRLAAELPQIRRRLFAAITEFQVQPSDRSVVVKHAKTCRSPVICGRIVLVVWWTGKTGRDKFQKLAESLAGRQSECRLDAKRVGCARLKRSC